MIGKMIMDGARDAEKVADVLQAIVDEPVTVAKKTAAVYLRRLFAEETIKLGDTVFAVYEMVVDGTFAQIFESLGDPNRLCFASREQVDEFCRVHRDKLRKGGYATFFLFKKGEEIFVADVFVYDGGRLFVSVFPLEYDFVWHAYCQHRIIVPQL